MENKTELVCALRWPLCAPRGGSNGLQPSLGAVPTTETMLPCVGRSIADAKYRRQGTGSGGKKAARFDWLTARNPQPPRRAPEPALSFFLPCAARLLCHPLLDPRDSAFQRPRSSLDAEQCFSPRGGSMPPTFSRTPGDQKRCVSRAEHCGCQEEHRSVRPGLHRRPS